MPADCFAAILVRKKEEISLQDARRDALGQSLDADPFRSAHDSGMMPPTNSISSCERAPI